VRVFKEDRPGRVVVGLIKSIFGAEMNEFRRCPPERKIGEFKFDEVINL